MKSSFKRAVVLVSVVILVFTGMYAYNFIADKGIVSDCKIYISDSEIFTEKEILKAMAAVKTKFRDFEGCTLLELTYDESFRNQRLTPSVTGDSDMKDDTDNENIIILVSTFEAVRPQGDSAFTEGIYNGWSWTLVRNSRNGRWKVDNWGYA